MLSADGVTAWMGNDGVIRFYDSNDQEVRVWGPDPWEFIDAEKPADNKKKTSGFLNKNRGGLIAI